jgi:hypothetical protein
VLQHALLAIPNVLRLVLAQQDTASGWRRPIMWSMRERKKSSVAGHANITAELPENSRYWI